MSSTLYSLMIWNDKEEGFFIGLFKTEEQAQKIARHYLSEVSGFRDYPCTYEITGKEVSGTIAPSRQVYMIWGWDEDAEGNDVGIWSSRCYAEHQEAQRALEEAKQRLNKQEWSLDTYRVGQCHWTEGFVRMFY